MKVLGSGPAARQDRPATALLHDEANARVVAFHLADGQSVAPHKSDSTVVVQVVSGTGVFSGSESEMTLAAGQGAVYEPGEMHGIDARYGELRFIAIITPRPG